MPKEGLPQHTGHCTLLLQLPPLHNLLEVGAGEEIHQILVLLQRVVEVEFLKLKNTNKMVHVKGLIYILKKTRWEEK